MSLLLSFVALNLVGVLAVTVRQQRRLRADVDALTSELHRLSCEVSNLRGGDLP